jgi:linoleoyl-CoA desaturase
MESMPLYSKHQADQQCFLELKKSVYQKVSSMGTDRQKWSRLKARILPLCYFAFYIIALQQSKHVWLFYFFYVLMGLMMVLLYLNIIHEASHNSLFRNKKINSLFMYLFDLIGANSYIWKLRHTRLHHNFSNVAGWDSDIQQSSLFKVFPSDETKRIHRNQHIRVFFVYPLYLLNWLLIRDFKDYFSKQQTIQKICKIPFIEYVKLFLFKSVFLFFIIIVPAVFFDFTWLQSLAAFVIMLIVAGVFALTVLLPPHANIKNDFPVVENGALSSSWFRHQLETTNDITTSNWFTRHIMGDFNYHLAHHLFPKISHVYASEVSKIIKEHASRYDLPYRSYTLFEALKYHYLLIKKNGMPQDFFEEDM